jgi:hypothetical protein
MTEAEWLASEDPMAMLAHLRAPFDGRKMLLLDCACLSRLNGRLPAICQEWASVAALVAEREAAPDHLWSHGLINNSGRLCDALWESIPEDDSDSDLFNIVYAIVNVCGRMWSLNIPSVCFSPGNAYWRAERRAHAGFIRCLFGNPFRPVAIDPGWRTSTVVALAEGVCADRAFDRLPILADALQDAGCEHPDILAHCRSDGPHVRGCWVVDLLLGKS